MQGKGRKVTGPNRREMPAIRCQQVASIEPFRNRYDAAIHQPKREIRVLLHEPGGAFQVADADRLDWKFERIEPANWTCDLMFWPIDKSKLPKGPFALSPMAGF